MMGVGDDFLLVYIINHYMKKVNKGEVMECKNRIMKAEHPTSGSMRWVSYCKATNKPCCECNKGRITKNDEPNGAEVTPSKFL